MSKRGRLLYGRPVPPGGRDLLPPAHEHIAEAAERIENRSFVLTAARAGVGKHATREARERQRLQPDLARTGERGEKQPFAAEDRVFEAADKADVVSDAWLQRDEAAGVELDRLPGASVFSTSVPPA